MKEEDAAEAMRIAAVGAALPYAGELVLPSGAEPMALEFEQPLAATKFAVVYREGEAPMFQFDLGKVKPEVVSFLKKGRHQAMLELAKARLSAMDFVGLASR